ncbi:RidA family protein [Microbacterium sp. NPDC007973]|uniref:RidA family protein n=1 Tax=Microbacterium sp. NPDC007973 TaxID=3364182 RepID=UPI0036E1620F
MLTPMGAYALTAEADGLLFVAGMTPREDDGSLRAGIVGADMDLETARTAATRAVTRALDAASENPRFVRVVAMTVYVRCAVDFTALSTVADAASAVVHAWAPDHPLPARAAVGVASLPGGAPVEVSLVLGAS